MTVKHVYTRTSTTRVMLDESELYWYGDAAKTISPAKDSCIERAILGLNDRAI